MAGAETLLKSQGALAELDTTARLAESHGERFSPVGIVSATFWRTGEQGLRESCDRLTRRGIKIIGDESPANPKQIPKDERSLYFVNYSALIFGIAIANVERAMVDGELRENKVFEQFNESIKGLPLLQFETPESDAVEKLPQAQRTAMFEAANADKTLSSFFAPGNEHLLPQTIREFLELTNNLSTIQTSILPSYAQYVHVRLQMKDKHQVKT